MDRDTPEPEGHWDDHKDYPLADWKYDVANDYTRLGYREWRLKRRDGDICRCQDKDPIAQREPGKHKPWCTDNPAYRAGDWN